MLTSINIGKRMGLAFTTLVCFALALAVMGYWGLHIVSDIAHDILRTDVVAADLSGQVQASTLNLRRYEKDYFLNMVDQKVRDDYFIHWKNERQTLFGLLDKLSGVIDESGRGKVNTMRTSLDRYDEGFEKVRDAIQAGL